MATRDRIDLPPFTEAFESPSGRFRFVLVAVDKWATPRSVGELWEKRRDRYEPLWSRALPHGYRPRFVLVDDQGRVALLDEWINVPTRHAVTVLGRDNRVVAAYAFEDVERALGVPGSKVVRMAKHGAWIAAPPVLDGAASRVTVQSAGRLISIDLETGHLSAADQQ